MSEPTFDRSEKAADVEQTKSRTYSQSPARNEPAHDAEIKSSGVMLGGTGQELGEGKPTDGNPGGFHEGSAVEDQNQDNSFAGYSGSQKETVERELSEGDAHKASGDATGRPSPDEVPSAAA